MGSDPFAEVKGRLDRTRSALNLREQETGGSLRARGREEGTAEKSTGEVGVGGTLPAVFFAYSDSVCSK